MLEIIKFLIFLFLAVFIPGFAVISRSGIEGRMSIKLLSLTLGLSIFTLAGIIGGYLGFRYLQLIITAVSLVSLIFQKSKIKDFFTDNVKILLKNKVTWFLFLIIVLGTIFQNLIPFKSGLNYDFGVGYWGPLAHDGIWHESLSQELVYHFPPNNPTLSGTKLTNYHYFYNLLVADTARFTGISLRNLIYRFYPILFSILLGLGSYLLSVKAFKDKWVGIFSLVFVYFGSSLGWIVEWLRQGSLGGESTFWANQPVSMNINPPFAISLVLLIAVVYLFFHLNQNQNDNYLNLAFVAIASVLIGFKVYAGIILLSGLGLLSLAQMLLKKDFFFLKLLIPTGLISLFFFLVQTSSSANLVEFKPLWLVDSMIDFGDRVGWIKLSSARNTYLSSGNWIKYLAAETLSLMIFFVGNLGGRVVGVFSIFCLVKNKVINSREFMFLFFLNLVSIIFTLLIVQKGNPWNVIQFFYYFMFFASVLAGLALYKIVTKLPQMVGVFFLILFFAVSSLSSFSTFRSGFQGAPARITIKESEALQFLKTQALGTIVTPPFNMALRKNFSSPFPASVYETSAYVSANTSKEVFVEDEFQQEIFQNDYKKRLEDSKSFFNGSDKSSSKEFLSRNKIRYIYIPKASSINLDSRGLNIEKIFENEEVVIYKV